MKHSLLSARGVAAMVALAVLAAACSAGPGSGDQPYYGAGDSRQPFGAGPPSTVASTPPPSPARRQRSEQSWSMVPAAPFTCLLGTTPGYRPA
ncbi:MAG: hypothetical protein QOF81_3612 [Acidimicrobiaceae bacterium]|jgi:hypothetical protein|nr:hypothetical protein [Acidimicrobiaceae bacterium]MDQ1417999.1 hypothetical protein [Acidimicrobiaceae bacterium]